MAKKQPSGAAGRKKKHDKNREEQIQSDAEDGGKWAEAFKAAGSPDLNNPDTDLDYVRKLQLIATEQMVTTPFPTYRQEQCWRRLKEMSAVVGMTSNRAALESKVRRLEAELRSTRAQGAVVIKPGAEVKRSPRARGQKTPLKPVEGPETE